MEIALITDTHSGVRNDSVSFHDKSKLFYDNVFFPYLQNHNITMMCHLGDLVDRRKYVNFNTASRLRNDFLQPLENMHVTSNFIAGNHDTFFKSSNELNSLRELIADRYCDFFIYDIHAEEIFPNDIPILMIPWICDHNREQILDKIKHTKAHIAFGHLELSGFEMNKGIMSSHGDDPELFSKFDVVCSGHYHHRSSMGNIHYLGSHAQFTWADFDDQRGFHIFDTHTRNLKFVPNPYVMFRKLIYNDMISDPSVPDDLDGCMVKIIVDEKTNAYAFEKYIEEVERQTTNLQIIDDHKKLDSDFEIVDRAQDTLSICVSYVEEMDFVNEKERERLKLLMADLYNHSSII